MSVLARLDGDLKAAGVTFVGLALLAPGQTPDPGWFVVEAPGGQRVRIDGVPPGDEAAATAVVLAFDFSPEAQALWEQQQQGAQVNSTTVLRLGANQGTVQTGLVGVPGLQFQLAPNRHYGFRFVGAYTTQTVNNAIRLSVAGPPSPLFVAYVTRVWEAETLVRSRGFGAYDQVLASPGGGGAVPLTFEIDGSISTGAAGGAFGLRGASETAGQAATVLAGTLGFLYGAG